MQEAKSDEAAELIRLGKHREAAIVCVREHGRALGSLCMALLGSQHDAEEVVQETLLVACAQMDRFRGDGTVRAWLFGIARRQCAKRIEKQSRERRRLELVPEREDGSGVAADSTSERHRARQIRLALAELKPSEREALVLRFEAGLSFREIAEQLGIDEAAARKRASRGLANLRSHFHHDES